MPGSEIGKDAAISQVATLERPTGIDTSLPQTLPETSGTHITDEQSQMVFSLHKPGIPAGEQRSNEGLKDVIGEKRVDHIVAEPVGETIVRGHDFRMGLFDAVKRLIVGANTPPAANSTVGVTSDLETEVASTGGGTPVDPPNNGGRGSNNQPPNGGPPTGPIEPNGTGDNNEEDGNSTELSAAPLEPEETVNRGVEKLWNPENREYDRSLALELTRIVSEINGLEGQERESRREEFLKCVRSLDRMGSASKFYDADDLVIEEWDKLRSYDEEALGKIQAADRPRVEELLKELDSLEFHTGELDVMLSRVNESRLPYGEKSNYEKCKESKRTTGVKLSETKRALTDLTGDPNFIGNRITKKEEIKKGIRNVKETQKLGSIEDSLIDLGSSPEEDRIFELLQQDKLPAIEIEPANLSSVPNYSELENTIREKGDDFKLDGIIAIRRATTEPLTSVTAKELKEWYFYNAKELGFFDLINAQLSESFVNTRTQISDTSTSLPSEVVNRFQKLAEEINSCESDFNWKVNISRLAMSSGMTMQQARDYVGRFKGIKSAFLESGCEQAQLVVEDLILTREFKMGIANKYDSRRIATVQILDYVRSNLVAGEFDMVKLELQLQKQGERGRRAETDQLYRFTWNQYELSGINREGVEQGAENAVNTLLESTSGYEVNAVVGRMDSLVEAIARQGNIIGLEQKEISYAQRTVVNRVLFHLGQWFGKMVQMDGYAQVVQKWATQDGDERLRVIPTMINGLAGKAIELRYRPEYRLSLRPEGWCGQLSGNQLTQRFIRANIEELMVEELMKYQLIEEENKDQRETRESLSGRLTQVAFDSKYEARGKHPRIILMEAKEKYDTLCKSVGNEATVKALTRLREVREEYNEARRVYKRARQDAKSAVSFSGEVMDFFLESAKIGAPSIRMQNKMINGKALEVNINGGGVEIKGDHMSIEDVTLILEYIVMQEAKRLQQVLLEKHGLDMPDTGALIRWRSRRFLGGQKIKPISEKEIKDMKPDHIDHVSVYVFENGVRTQKIMNLNDIFAIMEEDHGSSQQSNDTDSRKDLRVRKGFEYTGLTNSEFVALVNAFKKLKSDGYMAKFEFLDQKGDPVTKTISEILSEMKDLEPVLNHYMAVDIFGSDILTHPILNEDAKRGKQPFVANITSRLNWFGYQDLIDVLPNLDVKTKREQMEQVFENGRSFHDMVTEMVYYLGTRKVLEEVLNPTNYFEINHNDDVQDRDNHHAGFETRGIYADLTQYDDSEVMFGFPNITLGHKRIKYLNANWMLRQRERAARGNTLLPFIRISVPSLSEDLSAGNLLDAIWNMDKEYFDLPWLMGWGTRMKNAVDFRTRGETRINPENLKTEWGFWDKLLSDAERLRALFSDNQKLKELILDEKAAIHEDEAEKILSTLEDVLVRYIPMITLMSKSLTFDREALGSGAGDEATQKATLKFLSWLLSTGGSERRFQGGKLAHSDAEAILKLIMQVSSYRHKLEDTNPIQKYIHTENKSIWGRLWEKIKPRTAGVPLNPPLPRTVIS